MKRVLTQPFSRTAYWLPRNQPLGYFLFQDQTVVPMLNANGFMPCAVVPCDELDVHKIQQIGELYAQYWNIFGGISINLVENDGAHFALIQIPGKLCLVLSDLLKDNDPPATVVLFSWACTIQALQRNWGCRGILLLAYNTQCYRVSTLFENQTCSTYAWEQPWCPSYHEWAWPCNHPGMPAVFLARFWWNHPRTSGTPWVEGPGN